MKLTAYSALHETRAKLGAVVGDLIIDLVAAEEWAVKRDKLPAFWLPSTDRDPILALLNDPDGLEPVKTLLAALQEEDAVQLKVGAPLSEVTLRAPILHPPSLRDFYAFEQHVKTARANRGVDMIPEWYELAVFYFSNHNAIVGPHDPVKRPKASRALDFELEIAAVIGKAGIDIPASRADEYIAGFMVMNDWSARDIQAWEYQPLGPFLAKSFATTISPWVVTLEALEPYRVQALRRPPSDPAPLPYLTDPDDRDEGGFSIEVEMYLRTSGMRDTGMPAMRLSHANYRDCYWTLAQLVTHHTSNGCNLRAGDLLGSGTISGPTPDSAGAMIELTQGGKHSIKLPGGEQRNFVEDGDELTQRGRCSRDGFATIGFGEAVGLVLPSLK